MTVRGVSTVCFFYFTNCFTTKEINASQIQIVHFVFIYIYIFAEVALREKWHYTKCSKTKSEDQPVHPHSFTTVIPVIPVRILKICTTEANSPVCENMHVDLYRSCMPSISNFLTFYFPNAYQ